MHRCFAVTLVFVVDTKYHINTHVTSEDSCDYHMKMVLSIIA